MEPTDEHALIPRSSHELTVQQAAPGRILNEIVASSLALASEVAPAMADLDALVREGKRVQSGEGMTPENIQAFKLFYRAATAEHPEAQFLICDCYEFGRGAHADRAEYLKWLRRSAESGFSEAQNRLGWELLGNKRRSDAVSWLCMAAEQGNAKAQFNLFMIAKDSAERGHWLLKAGEAGHASAQRIIGYNYSRGEGVDQSDFVAAQWWRKAAEQGDEIGQYCLGRCYAAGKAVVQDPLEAFRLWSEAAKRGEGRAQLEVGRCYKQGVGVQRNIVEAYRWLRLAAEVLVERDKERAEAEKEAGSLEELMTPRELYAALEMCRKTHRELQEVEFLRMPQAWRNFFPIREQEWKPLKEKTLE